LNTDSRHFNADSRQINAVSTLIHAISTLVHAILTLFLDLTCLQRGLFKYEEKMLKSLGFILAVEHPHKFVIMYCQQLDLWPVAQTAWNYCNDLLRVDLCCRYRAEVLAVSALVDSFAAMPGNALSPL
jgi:hypothetical protein